MSNRHVSPKLTLFQILPTELRLKIYRLIIISIHSPNKRHILKLGPSSSFNATYYNSYTSPPITLSINRESRYFTLSSSSPYPYSHLYLGCPPPISLPKLNQDRSKCRQATTSYIPITFPTTTIYLTSFLSHHLPPLQSLIYSLSTSPSRHSISSLAVDQRIFPVLCEEGFLPLVIGLRNLRELLLVVEFGRDFKGELGFLEIPEWRGDLRWVGERAEREVRRLRDRSRSGKLKGEEGDGDISVRCVILTRGGEQA
jgi:hypothetical protein